MYIPRQITPYKVQPQIHVCMYLHMYKVQEGRLGQDSPRHGFMSQRSNVSPGMLECYRNVTIHPWMGSSVLHFTMQTDQTRQAGWQAAGRPGQAGNQANHMKYIICMFNFRIFLLFSSGILAQFLFLIRTKKVRHDALSRQQVLSTPSRRVFQQSFNNDAPAAYEIGSLDLGKIEQGTKLYRLACRLYLTREGIHACALDGWGPGLTQKPV